MKIGMRWILATLIGVAVPVLALWCTDYLGDRSDYPHVYDFAKFVVLLLFGVCHNEFATRIGLSPLSSYWSVGFALLAAYLLALRLSLLP